MNEPQRDRCLLLILKIVYLHFKSWYVTGISKEVKEKACLEVERFFDAVDKSITKEN